MKVTQKYILPMNSMGNATFPQESRKWLNTTWAHETQNEHVPLNLSLNLSEDCFPSCE